MPAEAQPGTCRRNMVGGAFALGLYQYEQLFKVTTVPGFERLEAL